MAARRFPPPWHADKIPGGYVVRDANGQALAYIYSRDNEAEALQAVLTPRQLVSRQGAPKGLRPVVVRS
jgi:hypothetical protein